MSKLQGGITMDAAQLIIEGKGYLGIEFGSTRIKAVLEAEFVFQSTHP